MNKLLIEYMLFEDSNDGEIKVMDKDGNIYKLIKEEKQSKEETIVRENLMNEEGYTPYCGSEKCFLNNPRTEWNHYYYQFTCKCGWKSKFPQDFINRYILKWSDKN